MNRIRIETLNPSAAELLASDSLGPGALVVIQSSAVGHGAGFTEIGTVPLVSGTNEYTFFDMAGAPGTYYRTTYDDATRTTAPDYSAEVQIAPESATYLTVPEFREHVVSSLPDTAIQRLLDANSLAITQRAGPVGTVSLTLTPSRDRWLFLDRPAASITSLTEFYPDPVGISGVTLDSTDYRLLAGGTMLERWGYGTHPGDWWSDRVELVYVAVDDTAERIRVLLKLCQLDLNREPGLSGIRVGDYLEQQRGEAYNEEREAILASLVPSALTFA